MSDTANFNQINDHPEEWSATSWEGSMLFSHLVNILCVTSGLTLFGLGLYGLMDNQSLDPHYLTEMLRPTGYGTGFDKIHLGLLAVLGFWLTIGLKTRVPAAIALALVLGKLLLVGDSLGLDKLLVLSLALICFAAVLRIITNPPRPADKPALKGGEWLW